MKGIDRLMQRVWRFRAEDAATVTIEFVLMAPIMVWGFLSTLQFFDAYRAELISTKAALTIADMYSRETGLVNSNYLSGTRDLLKYLTLAETSPDYRVTVFFWREDQQKYRISWSRNRGSHINHTTTTLNDISSNLPILSDRERAILVETWTDYAPKYGGGIGYMVGTGLDPVEFSTRVVISPRFATSVCFNNNPDDLTTLKC
ncbi:MAG: hypothetical protein ACI82I_001896 [Gammaproteobacteria bacterium]|jgi:hypothetical protein